jgi:hypothetical protein
MSKLFDLDGDPLAHLKPEPCIRPELELALEDAMKEAGSGKSDQELKRIMAGAEKQLQVSPERAEEIKRLARKQFEDPRSIFPGVSGHFEGGFYAQCKKALTAQAARRYTEILGELTESQAVEIETLNNTRREELLKILMALVERCGMTHAEVWILNQRGYSHRQIEAKIGVTKSTASRMLLYVEAQNFPIRRPGDVPPETISKQSRRGKNSTTKDSEWGSK